MEFIFETLYNQKGISVMAKALRKTTRKKKHKKTSVCAILIIIFAIILSLPEKNEEFIITSNLIITWIAVAIMVFTLLFEDKINGYFARKRMMKGMEKTVVTFNEEAYISETSVGKTEFYYNNISVIAEDEEYFIFVFDQRYAQIYDKKGITKGTIEEFKQFITEKTGKQIQII